jgi:hypothetical protein
MEIYYANTNKKKARLALSTSDGVFKAREVIRNNEEHCII